MSLQRISEWRLSWKGLCFFISKSKKPQELVTLENAQVFKYEKVVKRLIEKINAEVDAQKKLNKALGINIPHDKFYSVEGKL